MSLQPTKSVPGGCLIGTLALIPLTLFGVGSWGLIKWLLLPIDHRHFDQRFWFLFGTTTASGVIALATIAMACRTLRSTDCRDYDPSDPDRKNMKW